MNVPEQRGQVSVELFFSLALFMLVLLWAVNYANSFARSSETAAGASEAQAIASAAAQGLDAACTWGTSVSLHLPCGFEGGNFTPAIVTVSTGGWVSAWMPAFNANANHTIVCPGGGDQFVYRCDYANGTLACAHRAGNVARLQLGGCP